MKVAPEVTAAILSDLLQTSVDPSEALAELLLQQPLVLQSALWIALQKDSKRLSPALKLYWWQGNDGRPLSTDSAYGQAQALYVPDRKSQINHIASIIERGSPTPTWHARVRRGLQQLVWDSDWWHDIVQRDELTFAQARDRVDTYLYERGWRMLTDGPPVFDARSP